ncbi:recombinase family protein [Streptomyces hyaluromycini]|uniref:Recombinase family protein n=1 Tax=Streptomyces hyaluromycini TaxID=1377993 RepID=A0ABV1WYD5_9ACTN
MVVQAGLDRPAELVLDESGIEDPVIFEEDGATSCRLYPLQRPKSRELLTYARPGDTMHLSEMGRFVRGTGHTLDVLHRDQMALRIHDGAFSQMDLTARHPRTDELLSTLKFMVQTLAAAELQRDLQHELMYDGLRAAEAEGGRARPSPILRSPCRFESCPGTRRSSRPSGTGASYATAGGTW